MAELVNEFAQQTNRLRRRRWSRLNMLADEIETLFVNQAEETTGPIVADLRSSAGENVQFTSDPLKNLFFPRLDMDAPFGGDVAPSPNRSTRLTRIGTRESTSSLDYRFRSVCPGRIVSQEGNGTYTLDLYPDGTNSPPIRVAKAIHLNSDVTVQPNIWAPMVNRLSTIRVSEVEERPGFAGPLLSKRTTVNLLNREHYFAITAPWVPDTSVDTGGPNPTPALGSAPWGLGPRRELMPMSAIGVTVVIVNTWPIHNANSPTVTFTSGSIVIPASWAPNTSLMFGGGPIPSEQSGLPPGFGTPMDDMQFGGLVITATGGWGGTVSALMTGIQGNTGGQFQIGASLPISTWTQGSSLGGAINYYTRNVVIQGGTALADCTMSLTCTFNG